VRRRSGGEPMAHITGFTLFRDLRIHVRPGSFVPRQSSEFLAEQAIRRLARRHRPIAVDLACGIGPVALAMADAVPRAKGTAPTCWRSPFGTLAPTRSGSGSGTQPSTEGISTARSLGRCAVASM
jgi:hypothetical protein